MTWRGEDVDYYCLSAMAALAACSVLSFDTARVERVGRALYDDDKKAGIWTQATRSKLLYHKKLRGPIATPSSKVDLTDY